MPMPSEMEPFLTQEQSCGQYQGAKHKDAEDQLIEKIKGETETRWNCHAQSSDSVAAGSDTTGITRCVSSGCCKTGPT